MAKVIKPKFSIYREKTSSSFKDGNVTTELSYGEYVNISIKGSLNFEVINDLQNAVDEVLKHHGK